jgi:hypothetical protein
MLYGDAGVRTCAATSGYYHAASFLGLIRQTNSSIPSNHKNMLEIYQNYMFFIDTSHQPVLPARASYAWKLVTINRSVNGIYFILRTNLKFEPKKYGSIFLFNLGKLC